MEVHHHQHHNTDLNTQIPQGSGGGGGGGGGGDGRDRFPQWSQEEVRELLAIRAELDRSFMETKRNKLLWEAISARMAEKGFHRSPAQCKGKWKNLVTRYRGSVAMEERVIRLFPFHDDMQRILSERVESLPSFSEGKKQVSQEIIASSDCEKDGKACGEKQESSNKRKAAGGGGGDGRHDSNEVVENTLREFMRWRAREQSLWREAAEAREAERREKEREWRRAMEALAAERTTMEKRWREREEERQARAEARAERRHKLVAALLAKLAQKGL